MYPLVMAAKTARLVICVRVVECFLTIRIPQFRINVAAIQVFVRRMTGRLIKPQMAVRNTSQDNFGCTHCRFLLKYNSTGLAPDAGHKK